MYPAAVLDIKSAIKWVKENADKYDFDAMLIGAHLAMLAGFSSKVNLLNPIVNYEDSKIQAVVGLATPTDFSKMPDGKLITQWLGNTYAENEALWHSASPSSYIDEKSPPMLFIHSSSDPVIPFNQSVLSVNKLGTKGVFSELVLIPNAPHAFWNFEEWFTYTMDKTALFFHEHLE